MQSPSVLFLVHFLIYGFVVSVCLAIQGVVWPALNLPIPQLWLLPFAFIILYQSFWFGLFFVYLTSIVITGFTVMPFGLCLAILMILFITIQFFKQRFFWPEFSFYFLVCLSIGFLFPVLHFLLSITSKNTPTIIRPDFSEWIYQPIMISIMSIFLFFICRRIDKALKINEINLSRS
jgi:hypothetical protein